MKRKEKKMELSFDWELIVESLKLILGLLAVMGLMFIFFLFCLWLGE